MEGALVAVSNSSPLILYARVGCLDILRQLFEVILIPPAVHREVVIVGQGLPGAAAVGAAGWIHVRTITNHMLADALATESDRGEAEAVALAMELGKQITIILDDRQGRRLARERGLNLIGSAGVLVLAKQQGLISAIRPLLDELRTAGLRIGDGAYEEALAMAHESSPRHNGQDADH
jgi:predicted nucleic acid-binding protein